MIYRGEGGGDALVSNAKLELSRPNQSSRHRWLVCWLLLGWLDGFVVGCLASWLPWWAAGLLVGLLSGWVVDPGSLFVG